MDPQKIVFTRLLIEVGGDTLLPGSLIRKPSQLVSQDHYDPAE
jgi:hypothetical protein